MYLAKHAGKNCVKVFDRKRGVQVGRTRSLQSRQ